MGRFDINWTLDCSECPHHYTSRFGDSCEWGAVSKGFIRGPKRHCGKRHRLAGRNHADYLSRRQMLAENQKVEW